MSLTNKMQKQGGKPSGLFGTIIGRFMNFFHGNIHKWGLENHSINKNFICLDIGCGGGNAVKAIVKKAKNGKTYGLDHSPEMVHLSRKLNSSFIANGLVEINQGNVSALPYSDNQFDLVTAFETIQFWQDLKRDLKEVRRVLKPSGAFIIVNRYPPEDSKWTNFLQIKNAKDYEKILKSADFSDVCIDDKDKKGWIRVSARINDD